MKLKKIKINNFRCFGPKTTTIYFEKFTTFIGANSSGKTAAMLSLVKLFGTLPSEKEITRSDFHLPYGKKPEEVDSAEMYIEAVFTFPELQNEEETESAIPAFFKYFVVKDETSEPYLRIRLESSYINDGSIEGLIESKYYFIVAPESAEISESVKKHADKTILSNIRCIYVPALRNPSEQLRNVTGTLFNRLFKNIKWDEHTKEKLKKHIGIVNKTVQNIPDISKVNTTLQTQWSAFHGDNRYGTTKINVNSTEIDDLLKHTEISFSPTEVPRDYDISELGDGLRSLFYFSLVNTLLSMETDLLKEISTTPAEKDKKLITPPLLTFLAVEEPENHIAPQLLGKVILNLRKVSSLSNAQVVLSSHSASTIRRIDATTIRYFKMENKDYSVVKNILLPDKSDEKYKYIKGAVEAYPELYFSRMVILGEGESEQIVIPHFLEKAYGNADFLGISIAPLGGKHVNYFWKLLSDLNIPYITLLDLDRERYGGGWGRIKYVIEQLLNIGVDGNELLTDKNGLLLSTADLNSMHKWDIEKKEEMQFWIEKLEQYNVYFSAPLDLDFMLLEAFTDAYKDTVDEFYGPEIKNIGKIKDIEKERMTKDFKDRIKKDVKATLKEEGGDGHTYTSKQQRLMVWYKYLFLNRGKPSTHLVALPNCNINKLKDVPQPLRKIIIKIADGKNKL
ncbi:MAG: AAA family ATPase [Clostridia bacterium]|nr:AAA family ATPase [Clostridia bacterium]